MNKMLCLYALLGWLMIVNPATAQQESQEITVEPARDTTLFELGQNDPGGVIGNGGGEYIFTGLTERYGVRRALLYFDVANALPSDATITRATLYLTLNKWVEADANGVAIPANRDVTMHRVLADWGAADSGLNSGTLGGAGYPAEPGDATWTDTFYQSATWQTAGGDFDADVRATQFIWPREKGRTFAWAEPGMIEDVTAWLENPEQNYGWLLLGDEETKKAAMQFGSSEHVDEAFRPRLVIEYSTDAPDGNANLAVQFRTTSTDTRTNSLLLMSGVAIFLASMSCIISRKQHG